MAAQFPSKLDNGKKYYLTSDIFSSDKVTSKFLHDFLDHPHLQHQFRHHQLSSIDDLTHHFTALSLLQRQTLNPKPHTRIPHNFKRLNPPLRTGLLEPQLLPDYFRVSGNCGRGFERELGQRLSEYGTGSFFSFGSKPGYDLQFAKPTPAQLESFLKERADRILQGKQMENRLLQENRNMPFSIRGFGFKGGFARESGGTGVFHPLPRINNSNTAIATAARKQSVREILVMTGVRERQEIPATQERKSTKRPPVVGTDKQNPLPSDIRLPMEWTY